MKEGRDQFYRHVRQDIPEDVINGRQNGVCHVVGGGRAVGWSGTGHSRQKRLWEQSSRQEIGLVCSGNGR